MRLSTSAAISSTARSVAARVRTVKRLIWTLGADASSLVVADGVVEYSRKKKCVQCLRNSIICNLTRAVSLYYYFHYYF